MTYSGFMGGVFALTEWTVRFFVINVLWTITNLPVLLIMALIIFSQSTATIVIQAVPLVFLLPILLFPSTIAVFANVREWILNKEQTSLVKAYWRHLKENYKRSFWSGIVLTFIWSVWVIDFYYFHTQSNDLLVIVMFLTGLVLFVYTMNFFNLSVHYFMTKKELYKNALFVTLGNPLLFFLILMSNFLMIYVSIKTPFLFPFFTITLSTFLSFYAFYRFTLKVYEKSQTQKDNYI